MVNNIKHIDKFDTLNDGREKINKHAIDPANRAELNAIDAKSVANRAKQTSQNAEAIAVNTDDRLDNIIVGEMQDAEVIDARRPFGNEAYQTLGERLDSEKAEVTTQLQQTALNVGSFGIPFGNNGTATGDGTAALKTAVAFAKANRIGKIILPKSTYLFTDKINIDFDGIEIDGSGSTFLFNNENNIVNTPPYREQGLFSVNGRVAGLNVVPLAYEPKVTLAQPPKLSQGVITGRGSSVMYSRFKLSPSDLANFAIGDYIEVRSPQQGDSGFQEQTISDFRPSINIMCRVVEKDTINSYLYVDYWSPFDYSQHDLTTWKIDRVIPVKNVAFKNFKFRDITSMQYNTGNVNITVPYADSQRAVSGIGIKYGVDIRIENIVGEKTKYPLITTRFAYNVKIDDVVQNKPDWITGGAGYAAHIMGTMFCQINNIEGIETNSVVDFSYSAFCTCDNGRSSLSYSGKQFGTHGMGEHHITFRNTIGRFGFSNGMQYFEAIQSYITLENCEGELIDEDAFMDNLYVVNSKIYNQRNYDYLIKPLSITNATFDNCEFIFKELFLFQAQKRGLDVQTSLNFNNCKFTPLEKGTQNGLTGVYFKGFDSLRVDGGEIDLNDKDLAINIIDSNVLFSNTHLKDTRINLRNVTADEFVVSFDNCHFDYTPKFANTHVFYHAETVPNSKLIFKINDSIIRNRKGDFIRLLFTDTQQIINNWEMTVNINDTYIDGGTGKIYGTIMPSKKTYKVNVFGSGNIIKNSVIDTILNNNSKPLEANMNHYTLPNTSGSEKWVKIANHKMRTDFNQFVKIELALQSIPGGTYYQGDIIFSHTPSQGGRVVDLKAKANLTKTGFDMVESLKFLLITESSGVSEGELWLKVPNNMKAIYSCTMDYRSDGVVENGLMSLGGYVSTLPTAILTQDVVVI